MCLIRLLIAVLLATSLAILPVSAGMAMAHAAKAEMAMSASDGDCPCCNAAHKCAPDTCMLKCFSVSAIALDARPAVHPVPAPFPELGVTTLVAFSPRPDPPPPRS
jgi:hypothetical protein